MSTIAVILGGGRGTRRGTGFALDLPAYENDVLNALAQTGGFPGTDAVGPCTGCGPCAGTCR